jgi:hypothetical protein
MVSSYSECISVLPPKPEELLKAKIKEFSLRMIASPES